MANIEPTKEIPQSPADTSTHHALDQTTSSSLQSVATPSQTKKRVNLNNRIAKLEQQISATVAKQTEIDSQLKTKEFQAVVKAHIKLLHDYNEIRDVGQGLMGIIADQRSVRIVDVYRDFGVAEGD